jgi:hypothetical protein
MQEEINLPPIGDAEAVVFGSLTLFAIYGLSIYAGIKYIQKKFK